MMFTTFVTIAISICIAEMGDKTQLLVVGFAAKYKLRDIVFGVTFATILLNALGVILGSFLSTIIPMEYVSLAAGFFFLIFAMLSLKDESEQEHTAQANSTGRLGMTFGIGLAFFLAELGDKTQLSAIAFAAGNPGHLTAVFLGATLGMLLADGIGLATGLLLNKKLPERALKILSFVIFTGFGFHTLWESLNLFRPDGAVLPITAIGLIYVFLLFFTNAFHKKKEMC